VFDSYKRGCDSGRGAMLLAVANGRVCQGVDLSRHYGRCICILGVPEPQKLNPLLKVKSEFFDLKFQIPKEEFLAFNSMRIASQCFAKFLNSKLDYGIVLLADTRYDRANMRSVLSEWVRDFITKNQVNQTVDDAIEQAKGFFLKVSQVATPKAEAVADGDEIFS